MSSILVDPDLHEQYTTLMGKVEPLMEQADKTIFLGDWFDTFGDHNVEEMCGYIKGTRGDEKIVKLLGNHDCHYFFDHNGFMCSGWQPRTRMVVDQLLEPADIEEFKLFTQVGKFVLSHAGFHPATLQYFHPTVEKEALRTAREGGFDPIFSAGKARGGWVPVGGPTWLDWNQEFVPLATPQIVGHTYKRGQVRTKNDQGVMSYCLDSGLKHVMWTDGEEVEVVEL